jgi:hypothetical protein
MAPTVLPLAPELSEFAGTGKDAVILLRPDRFVMTTLTADSGLHTLDALQDALGTLPEAADTAGV